MDKYRNLVRMIIFTLYFILCFKCVILCEINHRKNSPLWKKSRDCLNCKSFHHDLCECFMYLYISFSDFFKNSVTLILSSCKSILFERAFVELVELWE